MSAFLARERTLSLTKAVDFDFVRITGTPLPPAADLPSAATFLTATNTGSAPLITVTTRREQPSARPLSSSRSASGGQAVYATNASEMFGSITPWGIAPRGGRRCADIQDLAD